MDRGILKNLSWLFVANILTKPLWFLFVIFSANKLGVDDFGIYTFSISYLLMFSMILDMGLEQLLIRDIAKDNNKLNNYFNNGICYKFFASLLLFLIIVSILYLSDYSIRIKYSLFLMLFFVLTTSFTTYIRAFFRAFEKIKYESISIIYEKMAGILFSGIGLLLGFGLFGFLIGLVLGNIVSLCYCSVILFRKNDAITFKPMVNEIQILLRKALPFLVADIFIIIYFRFSSVMIMFITGSETQVGLYNSSYRLIEMFLALPTLLITPVYPFISRTFREQKEKSIEIAIKILKLLLLISVPTSAVIFIDYIRINQFLFSDEFTSGAGGLQILILVIIPLSMNVLFGTILAAIGKQKEAAISVGIGTLINLILNYFLIRELNYIGACFAIAITESFIAMMYYYYVRKYFDNLNISSFLIKVLFISIVLGFLSYGLLNMEINLIASIILCCFVFTTLIFILKLFRFSQISGYLKTMIK